MYEDYEDVYDNYNDYAGGGYDDFYGGARPAKPFIIANYEDGINRYSYLYRNSLKYFDSKRTKAQKYAYARTKLKHLNNVNILEFPNDKEIHHRFNLLGKHFSEHAGPEPLVIPKFKGKKRKVAKKGYDFTEPFAKDLFERSKEADLDWVEFVWNEIQAGNISNAIKQIKKWKKICGSTERIFIKFLSDDRFRPMVMMEKEKKYAKEAPAGYAAYEPSFKIKKKKPKKKIISATRPIGVEETIARLPVTPFKPLGLDEYLAKKKIVRSPHIEYPEDLGYSLSKMYSEKAPKPIDYPEDLKYALSKMYSEKPKRSKGLPKDLSASLYRLYRRKPPIFVKPPPPPPEPKKLIPIPKTLTIIGQPKKKIPAPTRLTLKTDKELIIYDKKGKTVIPLPAKKKIPVPIGTEKELIYYDYAKGKKGKMAIPLPAKKKIIGKGFRNISSYFDLYAKSERPGPYKLRDLDYPLDIFPPDMPIDESTDLGKKLALFPKRRVVEPFIPPPPVAPPVVPPGARLARLLGEELGRRRRRPIAPPPPPPVARPGREFARLLGEEIGRRRRRPVLVPAPPPVARPGRAKTERKREYKKEKEDIFREERDYRRYRAEYDSSEDEE